MVIRRVLFTIVVAVVAGPVFGGGSREAAAPSADEATPAVEETEPRDAEVDGSLLEIDQELAEVLFSMGISPFESRIPSENFILPTLDGGERALDDYRGKLVFMNFWATWCPPCREEMPAMQVLYDELAGEGLEILAIDVLESEETVRAFISEFGFTYPVLLDRQGRVSARYAVRAFPTTYIVDRGGNVLGVRTGYHDWSAPEIVAGFRYLLEQ